MIDLHCHILPGLDDGAADYREALAMADMAARDGIGTIIATPHVTDLSQPNGIKRHVEELNNILREYQVPVTIVAGAEISATSLTPAMRNWALAGTDYLLLEFPHEYLPMSAEQDLWSLLDQGLRPIITHPERNSEVQRDPDAFLSWLPPGILLQVTAGSVTGEFGPIARDCALFLLHQGAVSFLATDAHSSRVRKPQLTAAVAKTARLIGRQQAEALVQDNPRQLLQNQPINR